MNLGTFIVLIILLSIVGTIIYQLKKDKKQGKSMCCGNCQACKRCHH